MLSFEEERRDWCWYWGVLEKAAQLLKSSGYVLILKNMIGVYAVVM
jgi:hypothetical protein